MADEMEGSHIGGSRDMVVCEYTGKPHGGISVCRGGYAEDAKKERGGKVRIGRGERDRGGKGRERVNRVGTL